MTGQVLGRVAGGEPEIQWRQGSAFKLPMWPGPAQGLEGPGLSVPRSKLPSCHAQPSSCPSTPLLSGRLCLLPSACCAASHHTFAQVGTLPGSGPHKLIATAPANARDHVLKVRQWQLPFNEIYSSASTVRTPQETCSGYSVKLIYRTKKPGLTEVRLLEVSHL